MILISLIFFLLSNIFQVNTAQFPAIIEPIIYQKESNPSAAHSEIIISIKEYLDFKRAFSSVRSLEDPALPQVTMFRKLCFLIEKAPSFKNQPFKLMVSCEDEKYSFSLIFNTPKTQISKSLPVTHLKVQGSTNRIPTEIKNFLDSIFKKKTFWNTKIKLKVTILLVMAGFLKARSRIIGKLRQTFHKFNRRKPTKNNVINLKMNSICVKIYSFITSICSGSYAYCVPTTPQNFYGYENIILGIPNEIEGSYDDYFNSFWESLITNKTEDSKEPKLSKRASLSLVIPLSLMLRAMNFEVQHECNCAPIFKEKRLKTSSFERLLQQPIEQLAMAHAITIFLIDDIKYTNASCINICNPTKRLVSKIQSRLPQSCNVIYISFQKKYSLSFLTENSIFNHYRLKENLERLLA